MRRIVLCFATVAVVGFLINCSPVQFTKINNQQNRDQEGEGNVIQASPEIDAANAAVIKPGKNENPKTIQCSQDFAKMQIKVLFVVDTSGSNAYAYLGSNGSCTGRLGCVPATDPQKKFRGGSISEFFEKYKSKQNFSWGFETFSGHNVKSYIGQNIHNIFGDAQAMESAINIFAQETDRGKTPYLKAMEGIQVAIANDSDMNSKVDFPPLYYIVFMSDGYPTDSTTTEINAYVRNIISLDPTRISLSTIYYGTQNDPYAAQTLQNMAFSGGGQFVNFDTNSNETIAIQDLIGLPTTTCL